MAFLESPRFPDSVAEGSGGGPTFKTDVFTTNTALETRSARWSRPKHKYNAGFGILTTSDMDAVRVFFLVTRGRYNSFRFKDWNDYQLTSELIGTGNGVQLVYNITKKYTTGAYSYTRPIYKPVASGLLVYVNNVLKTLTTDYTINTATGAITFVVAPPNTHTVKVTCEFDVPVTFGDDALQALHVGLASEDWASFTLVEDLTEFT